MSLHPFASPRVRLCSLLLLVAPVAWAQPDAGAPSHPSPPPPEVTLRLEPLKLGTFVGTVKEVTRHLLLPGVEGLDLHVEVAGRTLVAHLGPEAFVHPRMRFEVGDAVELRAAELPGEPSVALLTLTVTKDGRRLVLRNERGEPKYPLPGPQQR